MVGFDDQKKCTSLWFREWPKCTAVLFFEKEIKLGIKEQLSEVPVSLLRPRHQT